ncbi:MAG TPA: hypothetical protein VKP69_20630, partial [Isosphaeraceae bacterium]|nr:hypothetical protein [Isosphaeraceae bacterium]
MTAIPSMEKARFEKPMHHKRWQVTKIKIRITPASVIRHLPPCIVSAHPVCGRISGNRITSRILGRFNKSMQS